MAAGSAVAMIGANLRFGSSAANLSLNATRVFQCHPGGTAEATLIFALGTMGMGANLAMMAVILANRQLRRWSQGLLFHQGAVDCARAALLLPLGMSILHCQPVNKCSLVETAFLLLVTVATVNMLTTVLNDSPIFPEDDSEDDRDLADAPLLMDSPQCVLFGTFMIWFASITINLGPTFLSGALAAQGESGHKTPSCPLIHGPLRHYILNALWIMVNLVCVFLTLFHLRKLHRDLTKANVEAVRVTGLVTTLVNVTGGAPRGAGSTQGTLVAGGGMQNGNAERATGALEEHRRMREYLDRMERDGVQRVKMFLVITAAYVLFWGPLFFVTLVNHPIVGNRLGHEITLHISYVHAIVNPTLFLVLHRGLRRAALDLCCGWVPLWICGGGSSCCSRRGDICRRRNRVPPPPNPPRPDISLLKTPLPTPAQPDSSMGNAHMSNTPAIPNRPWTPEQLSAPILPHHYKKAQSLMMLYHNDLLDDEFAYSETINDDLQPILPLLLPLQQQQQRVKDLLEQQLIQRRANNVITNQTIIGQKPILLKQRSFDRPRASYQHGGVQEHILRHREALNLKLSQETIKTHPNKLVDQQTQFSIDEHTPLLRQFGTGQSGQLPLSVSVMTSPPPGDVIMSPVTSVTDSDL